MYNLITDQVRPKPTKEIKDMMKPTKKPAVPISKPSPGFSTPRVYKPASKTTSLSTLSLL
ncbi:hypothetical protein Bca52824_011968 [Brassica carinata]|uniref:Uncharacterized protein n=1 Tax=Brassica carinata TaxID=52824 RepID=A0A8X7VXA0_BRACI|nr:hypothetical protein Bca52824_011968 [Brassica carinata]